MSVHLYVYYKVDEADAAAMLERVHAMQAELIASTSIRARLQRRVNRDGDEQTWMEIYPDAPTDFEARLATAVEAGGVAAGGPRHVERFEDIA